MTELHLQLLSGESFSHNSAITEDGARLDVAMYGFWGGRFEKAFVDVRVFNPSAQSNRHGPLSSVYRKHEQEKKRQYDQRVHEVEHATFTPLVLSATGGMGRAATTFYKRLVSMITEQRGTAYEYSELDPMPTEFCSSESLDHGHQGGQIISPLSSYRVPN